MVLKILSFLFILYLIYRFIGFFFKVFYVLLGQRSKGQRQSRNGFNRRRPEGSIHVEKEPSRKKKKEVDFRGGEYVDYEEVDK